MILVGRTTELAELTTLLESARAGQSSSLVVHGEAGIGKSTLLDEAAAAADGFRVLRARVRVRVDDVHWLDAASLEALLFVARRLSAEGVVLLLGARDGEGLDPDTLGLPRLAVAGLDAGSARALLADRSESLPGPVADQLLATAADNPLALIEIPSALSSAQLAGREPLPAPLPVGTSVESAFQRRLESVGPDARRALVVISAMETNRVDLLHAAMDHLAIAREALGEAEDAGLAHYDAGRIELRHPCCAPPSTTARRRPSGAPPTRRWSSSAAALA